jgi:hypothetical protein
MIIYPRFVDPPLTVFMVPPIALFIFKVIKLAHLYRTRIGATRIQTVTAAFSGLALSHSIAKAVMNGIFTSGKPFFRTPKCENSPALIKALAASFEETILAVILLTTAIGIIATQGKESPDAILWGEVLIIQSMPYLAALLMSLINVLPKHHAKKFDAQSCSSPALATSKPMA